MSVTPLSSRSADKLPDPSGRLLWFAMLGPLQVEVAASRAPVAGIRARSLLILLLLHRNQVVRLDRLIEFIWEAPPATAVPQVRNLVAELRRVLQAAGQEIIETSLGGYRLVATDDEVDVAQAEHHVAEGTTAAAEGDHRLALECFGRSLALWRGEPLGDVAPSLALAWRPRFTELRRRALLGKARSRLNLEMFEQAVIELLDAVVEFPFEEELRLLLVTALYRSGRSTAALKSCRDARHYFLDELGVDPSPALRSLEVEILRGGSPR
ncbi:Transcriptional regulator, SARP family [Frankia canadensis]|uniref:Transcriptional regulator, SARP family n=1 Tax=Frankia canadensis TaxID=1836972 RepID=A0A2I2KTJ7_9ACTN|nr:Transcriptional regulator, SARP family [Frankia canadensis]SOU56272.1 Transcriptional regulator, SARP family [Frankia canadensis]